jgi:hypothetical protein
MGKLKIVVIYDRVLVDEDEESASPSEKSPVTRALDKKEVEEEVAEALVKLGHNPVMHETRDRWHHQEPACARQSGLRSRFQSLRVVCR